MVGEAEMPPVLDRAFIAAELGVRPNTITYYPRRVAAGRTVREEALPGA